MKFDELKPRHVYLLSYGFTGVTSDPVRTEFMPEGFGQRKVAHVKLFELTGPDSTIDPHSGWWEPVSAIRDELGPIDNPEEITAAEPESIRVADYTLAALIAALRAEYPEHLSLVDVIDSASVATMTPELSKALHALDVWDVQRRKGETP